MPTIPIVYTVKGLETAEEAAKRLAAAQVNAGRAAASAWNPAIAAAKRYQSQLQATQQAAKTAAAPVNGAAAASAWNPAISAAKQYQAQLKATSDAAKQAAKDASDAARQTAQAQRAAAAHGGAGSLNRGLYDARQAAEDKYGALAASGGAMRGAGAVAAGAGLGIGYIGAQAVQSAGQMEQYRIAFAQLMGSAEAGDAKLRELQTFAARTPFTMQGLVQNSQQLIAMGFSANETIPTLQALGDAMAATGQGEEVLNRVALNLGQIRNMAHPGAVDLKQFAYAGINVEDVVSRGAGKKTTTAEIKEMSGTQFVDVFLKGLEAKYSGMMEAQSKTLLGTLSNLQDAMFQAGAAVGQYLIPPIRFFTGLIITLANWFSALPGPIQATLAYGGALVAALLILGGGLLIVAGTVASSVVAIATYAGAVGLSGVTAGTATPMIAGLGTAIMSALLPALAAAGVAMLQVAAVALIAAAAMYVIDKALHWKEDKELAANIARGDEAGQKLLEIENRRRARHGLKQVTMAEFQGNPNIDDTGSAGGMPDIAAMQANVAAMQAQAARPVTVSTAAGVAVTPSAASDIEALQDEVAQSRKGYKPGSASERLRLARREVAHQRGATTAGKRQEAEQRKLEHEHARTESQLARADAAGRVAQVNAERDRAIAQDKAATDEQVVGLRANHRGSRALTEQIRQLHAAHANRANALRAGAAREIGGLHAGAITGTGLVAEAQRRAALAIGGAAAMGYGPVGGGGRGTAGNDIMAALRAGALPGGGTGASSAGAVPAAGGGGGTRTVTAQVQSMTELPGGEVVRVIFAPLDISRGDYRRDVRGIRGTSGGGF